MSDPAILFVKPGALNRRDRAALRKAGVLVVEVDDPSSVKLTRASAEIDGSDLLRAAASAIKSSNSYGDVRELFAKAICAAIEAGVSPSPTGREG